MVVVGPQAGGCQQHTPLYECWMMMRNMGADDATRRVPDQRDRPQVECAHEFDDRRTALLDRLPGKRSPARLSVPRELDSNERCPVSERRFEPTKISHTAGQTMYGDDGRRSLSERCRVGKPTTSIRVTVPGRIDGALRRQPRQCMDPQPARDTNPRSPILRGLARAADRRHFPDAKAW